MLTHSNHVNYLDITIPMHQISEINILGNKVSYRGFSRDVIAVTASHIGVLIDIHNCAR